MQQHWQDIEAIKKLKARYFRHLDQKNWEQLRAVFCDDFTGVFKGPHPDIHYSSADEMVKTLSETLQSTTTVHHGHMPEITITGEDEAEGIWAMMDFVQMEGMAFRGYGHYNERYRRVDGEWKIAHCELSRLHIQQLDKPGT